MWRLWRKKALVARIVVQEPRIVWMLDESIAETHPRDWDKLRKLYSELVSKIGRTGFSHEIADPIIGFENIAKQLAGKDVSTVIDLAGWAGGFFGACFPEAEIITDFGMSRIRGISDPTLPTTGHLLKVDQDRIDQIKKKDLSRLLLFDDTSITGTTAISTAQRFGANGNVLHAYLIMNTNDCASQLKSAKKRIEELGQDFVCGLEVAFPIDDGWHLKDLHQVSEQSFYKALELQLFFQQQDESSVKKFLQDQEIIETLFPNRFSSKQICDLYSLGRVVLHNGHVPSNGTVHVTNPILWASKYPMDHVEIEKVLENPKETFGLLKELNRLTVGYSQVKQEVDCELAKIARRYGK